MKDEKKLPNDFDVDVSKWTKENPNHVLDGLPIDEVEKIYVQTGWMPLKKDRRLGRRNKGQTPPGTKEVLIFERTKEVLIFEN